MGITAEKRCSLRQFRPSFCYNEAFRFGSEAAHPVAGLVGRRDGNVAWRRHLTKILSPPRL
ncbi:hypothetical protein GFL78_17525 [Rhizobium leguminosarum bv. viciae]|nr:hypothetical protein [Rhizobium leguminosarum bv. viciae]